MAKKKKLLPLSQRGDQVVAECLGALLLGLGLFYLVANLGLFGKLPTKDEDSAAIRNVGGHPELE